MATDDSSDQQPQDYTKGLSLVDRGVVVLGAGQGIGRQVVHAVAQTGAKVMCVDVDARRAAEVADQVEGVAWTADISSRADMEDLMGAASRQLPTFHGVVGVPAVGGITPIDDVDDHEFQRCVDGNLKYALLAIQLGTRHMADGGSIVLVASGAGLYSSAWRSLYGATKAGMISLTKSAGVEYGSRSIRVNAVAPGLTVTPHLMSVRADLDRFAGETIPLGRACEPSDIAACILFLLSDLAQMITGQTILVDGGLSLVRVQPDMGR